MRYEHESKIHISILRSYIFSSFFYAVLQIIFEDFLKSNSFLWILLFRKAIIVFQRKLRVYGNNFIFNEYCGIYDSAIREFILHFKASRRENIFKKGLKKVFP